jgi:hypothetical protein
MYSSLSALLPNRLGPFLIKDFDSQDALMIPAVADKTTTMSDSELRDFFQLWLKDHCAPTGSKKKNSKHDTASSLPVLLANIEAILVPMQLQREEKRKSDAETYCKLLTLHKLSSESESVQLREKEAEVRALESQLLVQSSMEERQKAVISYISEQMPQLLSPLLSMGIPQLDEDVQKKVNPSEKKRYFVHPHPHIYCVCFSIVDYY